MRSLLDDPVQTLFGLLTHELRLESITRPLSLVFFDVDDLTGLNRRSGWNVGNEVLTDIGNILTAFSANAVAGSYGGDQFAVVIRGMKKRVAAAQARQVLAAVAALGPLRRERIHASAGGATSTAESTPDGLIRSAHSALVAAKSAGGNCVRWT